MFLFKERSDDPVAICFKWCETITFLVPINGKHDLKYKTFFEILGSKIKQKCYQFQIFNQNNKCLYSKESKSRRYFNFSPIFYNINAMKHDWSKGGTSDWPNLSNI